MSAVPKPPVREKKPSKPLSRKTRLVAKTSIAKVNVEATKKRAKRRPNRWAHPDDKVTRALAFLRANDRCEYVVNVGPFEERCHRALGHGDVLECHHRRYRDPGMLRLRDVQILCNQHHALIEATQYSYRQQRRKATA